MANHVAESVLPHLIASSFVQFSARKFFSCCFSTEPNAPPANVAGHNASSTSIFVSWGQVPVSDQNGVILSYTVTYMALPGGSSQTKDVTAPANQTTLTGLNEYTNYSITVFASTSKGVGIQSAPIVVITDEDSELYLVLFVYGLSNFNMVIVFAKKSDFEKVE